MVGIQIVQRFIITLFLILLTCQVVSIYAWDISLKIAQSASNGKGGEVFAIQPIIEIFDKAGVMKRVNLLGRVVASLGHHSNSNSNSNSNLNLNLDDEKLGIFTDTCDVDASGGKVSVDLDGGNANFSGLCVNQIGKDYEIRYTLFDEFDIILGTVSQSNLSVEIGEPFSMGIVQYPVDCRGGVTWSVSPIIAIQDRGRNTVIDFNTGTVTVALATNPNSEDLIFEVLYDVDFDVAHQILSPNQLDWTNGTAEFHGLSIKTVRHSHQLKFTTDVNIPGGSYFLSENIHVTTGPPFALRVIEEQGLSEVFGGKAFVHQPLLHIVDAGGNIVESDSTSRVVASIYNNPITYGESVLHPSSSTIVKAEKGVVRFKSLSIAQAAKLYRLKYWIQNTNITVVGDFFDVKVGPPQRLKILREPKQSWAGNQPFKVQPKVALVDAGGNTLTDVSDIDIDVTVVPSLSQTSEIVIDTSLDAGPAITSIELHESMLESVHNSYSNGHNISIVVNFSQEVFISLPTISGGNHPPTLTLNIIDPDGSRSKASLSEPFDLDVAASFLVFVYNVAVNSVQSVVNIFDGALLELNDYIFRDAWERNVIVTIPPSSVIPVAMDVTDQPVFITEITSPIPDGEYGPGEEIEFIVAFSDKVAVVGSPYLPIDVRSTIQLFDTVSLGTSLSTSYFHILYGDDKSESIPWDASSSFIKKKVEEMESIRGSVCVARSKSLQSSGYRWVIRFDSIWDDISVGLIPEYATVRRAHRPITLSVSYLIENKIVPGWVHDDGDLTMCTFRHATYMGGTGTDRLLFRYTSLPGDVSSGMGINLSAPPSVGVDFGSDNISNALNSGSSSGINANLIWNDAFERNIAINFTAPSVVDVIISSSKELVEDTFRAGDVLLFQVIFDKPIIASDHIKLQLKSVKYKGAFAIFHSKSTHSITFKYVILEGDWSHDLQLEDPQNVIIILEKEEYIKRDSTTPVTDANIVIPWSWVNEIPTIQIDARPARIVAIKCASGQDGNTFSRGEDIFIEVHLSSPIVIYEGPPVLIVHAGGGYNEAVYNAGNQTSLLTFKYTIITGDGTSPLVCNMLCVASGCLEGVSREGYILQMSTNPIYDADLELPGNKIDEKGMSVYSLSPLVIDTITNAPQTVVESISLLHKGGTVGIGEVIRVRIDFSDEVFCEGRKPELSLSSESNALYENGTGTKVLIFVLRTSILDTVQHLAWELIDGTKSPILCDPDAFQPCMILNGNEDHADLSFVDNTGNPILEALSPTIDISLTVPAIISVYADVYDPEYCDHYSCKYTAGDQITIVAHFDTPVIVTGTPTILLEVWDEEENNIRAVFNPLLSTDMNIVFVYEISLGHTSRALPLKYTTASIDISTTNAASVKRKSTSPSIDANLILPNADENPLRNQGNAYIVVEAIAVPSVRRVHFNNETNTYSPGDRLVLTVEFDQVVSVSGSPVLLLDVGNDNVGCATYLSGTGTEEIQFQYDVQLEHCKISVDYMNRYALETSTTAYCNNAPGTLKRTSASPFIDANLMLPDPGTEGSISSHNRFLIDCKVPFISRLWSPQSPGRYTTNDMISVMVEFSKAVIVQGNPTLRLETGDNDRYANFKSQYDANTLEFEYVVKLGDYTQNLDYWAIEEIDRSSISSIDLYKSSILVPASHPILNADVHLNPTFGHLDGITGNIQIKEGEAEYYGLKIGKRGEDYKLRFRTSYGGGTYDADMNVLVTDSSEFELNGNEADRDFCDEFGTTVAISDTLLAVGAPKKKNPKFEVQVLRVQSQATHIQREVQLITTEVDVDSAIMASQSFSTYAAANVTINGYFTIEYRDPQNNYSYSSPLKLAADVDEIFMEKKLKDYFPILGDIQVSRENNNESNCLNGWTWNIIFLDASQGIGILTTDGSDLEGNGANITVSQHVFQTNMIGGYFSLKNPSTSMVSRSIPYNADTAEIKEIIETDLGLNIFNIQVSNMDHRNIAKLGRKWIITFASHHGTFGKDINVPNLIANPAFLTGANASIWCHVGSEGKSPLSGSFALSLRGSEFSSFILHDSSADEVKQALESLASVNKVSISERKSLPLVSGYEWTITFISVNVLTDYGWILDPGATSSYGNLPSLEVNSSQLIGWKTKTVVDFESGSGSNDTQAQWMEKDMGDDGTGAGEVAIYSETSNGWEIEDYISALDASAHDNFGSSISLTDSLIAVGAPNGEVNGLPEKQSVVCLDNPTGGTFTITLRGHKSENISYNSTLNGIHSALQGIYGDTRRVHSLPAFALESENQWSEFCSTSGNTFTITLLTPDGGGISTIDGASGDIELLHVEHNLVGGSIQVVEKRKGTKTLSGHSDHGIPMGRQSGAVYLFERRKPCDFCNHKWHQIQKLTTLDCLEMPNSSQQFGFSVAIQDDVIFVGSPGFGNETGRVFTFRKDTKDDWICGEYLTSLVWAEQTPGDQFGYSIAADHVDYSVLISAPGHNNDEGAVYVFGKNTKNKRVLSSQEIKKPLGILNSRFGHALSVSDNEAIVCAPEDKNTTVGSCFAYERLTFQHHFLMTQELIPSNIREQDRFGSSVSISTNKILVGQVQKYEGDTRPSASVQIVTTRCGISSCDEKLGSNFQLTWRDKSFKTRPLSHSISSKQLKRAIEEDLRTGTIRVERTEYSDENGGYRWSITFLSYGHYASDVNEVPVLRCDSSLLSGSKAECDVAIKDDRPMKVRSKVHLFQKRENVWTEQAYLFPADPQPQDFYGTSVALTRSGKTALIGAPNRNLLNVNSGAAMIVDLSFANFFFESNSYAVREGDSIMLPVRKFDNTKRHILRTKSIDINAGKDTQKYIQALWEIPYMQEGTIIQRVGGDTALANDQYYGDVENRSEWISGMFDYRGMNDYRSINDVKITGSETEYITVQTTSDTIFEAPDETLTVQISSPGMFASPLGHLRTKVTIEDDGDGFVEDETHYTKLFESISGLEEKFSTTVDILPDETFSVIGSSAHEATMKGFAHLYSKNKGKWVHLVQLTPNKDAPVGSTFGQSISMTKSLDNAITILIGEPGLLVVHVFVYDITSKNLTYQSGLRPFDEELITVEHKFASRHAVDVNGDLAFVGASKMELVFIYRRSLDEESNQIVWNQWTKLKSSQYDFDKYGKGNSVEHVHQQRFGLSVVAKDRYVLVSAPHADYGNRGDISIREEFDTDGLHNVGLGKGNVFVFHSAPYIYKISYSSQQLLSQGSFKLLFDSQISSTSSEIAFDASGATVTLIIEDLQTLGKVAVNEDHKFNGDTGVYQYSWSIAFLSIFHDSDAPSMATIWYGHDCNNCERFEDINGTVINPIFNVELVSAAGPFVENSILQGKDVTSGDCFGCSIDFDNDLAIIGAPFSSAKTRTSWDFETGDLTGWFSTGNAFDYQPTYGDNSRRRMVYKGIGALSSHTSGEPQSSLHQGRYYIGTFEKRPGNQTDYLKPNNEYNEGDIQGDEPVGTLSSDAFIISGDEISFLIGGGCDHLTEYVELIVDGFATMRATGKCSERMDTIYWDVTVHKGRAAQIKIVDASKQHWGHINVDRIQFSWAPHGTKGGCSNTGGVLSNDGTATHKQHYSGREESPKSGSAYIFKRHCKDWLSTQTSNDCNWVQEQRLVPSDKRSKNLFGASVSIDSVDGIAIVGSPNSPVYGFYKETPSIHPFDEERIQFPVASNNEHLMKSADILSATPGNLRLLDHMKQNMTQILQTSLPSKFSENAGAFYSYLNDVQNVSSNLALSKTSWSIVEHARIAPPDVQGRTIFGSSLSVARTVVIVGAASRGSAFLFGLKWRHLRFSSIEYVGLEGTDKEVVVNVVRDKNDHDVNIGYSTSDLSATGVDQTKILKCHELSIENRSGCGDYEQTAGILHLAKGQSVASFSIKIVDDNCRERHMEYVQLNLHIPGGGPIQGDQFRAQLRIDDNDWDSTVCSSGIS